MKRSRIKHRKTTRTPEAQSHLDDFRDRWIDKLCWLCGESVYVNTIHHIVRRRGDVYDDPRNLSLVCWMCHQRIHHGDQRLVSGTILRAWTDEDVERAKRRHDPDNYDPAFLDYLRCPEKYEREHGTMIYQEGDNENR